MKKTLLLSIFLLMTGLCFAQAGSIPNKEAYILKDITKPNQRKVIINKDNAWNIVDKKAKWFKKGLMPQKSLKILPKEFIDFCTNYINDSLYQKRHINFNMLIGVIGECDSTIILNSQNWEYSSWNFIKEFSKGNKFESADKWDNRFYFSGDRVYFEFKLKEIGVISQFGFEKINKEWTLTLDYTNVC